MEEALKARLIGAAVLVAIAVLLVPELLSGRKAVEPVAEQGTGSRGTRTFTIELGGATDPSVRSPMTSAPPAAGAPAPVVTQADSSRPEPEPDVESLPQPGQQAAATQPPPAQSAAPSTAPAPGEPAVESPPVVAAPAAAGGDWAVQVGAFGSADTARKLVKDLAGAGYRAYVSPVQKGGKTLHRVRVGPEADKASAEQVAQRLKGRGLPATVVRND